VTVVTLKNPRTRVSKDIKIGWNWPLFLFSNFLGLPLFLRRLNSWGAAFMGLWVLNIFVSVLGLGFLRIIIVLAGVGLAIWMGRKGNELTAKNLLATGWLWADPRAPEVAAAKRAWDIAY
jgi:hypothetical protein